MIETAIGIVLTGAGIYVFWRLLQMIQGLGRSQGSDDVSADEETPARVEPEGELGHDGLVYMFAGKFAKEAPRRALGSIPRDRAYDLTTGDEVDPRDLAQQIVYATLIDLYSQGHVEFKAVPRQASFMPPFPHKSWELCLRQTEVFGSGPLCDSLNIAFEMVYKKRLKQAERNGENALVEDEQWVNLDELLENALKAMRQEMSFWERGSIYSDLRNYVGIGLTAQGYLLPPADDTWLDRVRRKSPSPNPAAMEMYSLEKKADELLERIAAFRARLGSSAASDDPNWPTGEVDPGLLTPTCPLADLPVDDCIRLSIYEALVAIRQLEPSGEAGV
jgi:hypothetical protein